MRRDFATLVSRDGAWDKAGISVSIDRQKSELVILDFWRSQ